MKKLRRLCLTLIIAVLSVTMLMGTLAMTAFAADAFRPGNFSSSVSTPTKFYSTFVYGTEYEVGTGATVTAPNGQLATMNGTKVVANQVGAYKISYGTYSYNVKCSMDKDYELRVDYGGAEIATYLKKGSELTIPAASIWYKNDDGEYVKAEDIVVSSIIDGVDSGAVAATQPRTLVIDVVGTHTIHYFATIGTAGTKYISQDFTTKVQTKFEDKTKPIINVVNVPGQISYKTKVTLPIATPTDDYDSNVKVSVKVTQYDEATKSYIPVKVVEPDANGYGQAPKPDAKDVVFDNKYNMSFYPMALSTGDKNYKIVYTATDDRGEVLGSVTNSHDATCVDKSAPILKTIEDSQIPTKWGVSSVKNANTPTTSTTEDLIIDFPFPNYVDNASENFTVGFEIRDTINNQTVIKFSNIRDQGGNGSKYNYSADSKSNGILNDGIEHIFKTDGLKLNLGTYCNQIKEDSKTYIGDYTVTYTAFDTKNTSTKTYTINMAEALSDTSAPDAKVTFNDKYLVVTDSDTVFNVPVLKPSDDSDTRLTVDYKLSNGTDSIDVKGGESATLKMDGVKPTLVVKNSDKDLADLVLDLTSGKLIYDVTVTDDAGNVTNINNKTDAIKKTEPIKVWKATDFADWKTVLVEDLTGITASTDSAVLNAEGELELGGFTLEAKAGMRDYVGYEMTLTNSQNEIISTDINFTTYFDKKGATDNSGVNQIENIKFTPKSSDTYTLYIRIFDVTGRSTVTSYDYKVTKPSDGDGPEFSSANIPNTGSVYTTYQLKNVGVKSPDGDPLKQYVVREMTAAGKFSVMGTQFTAYTEGNYSFVDSYYKIIDGKSTLTPYNNDDANGKYTLNVSQSGTPAWQLQSRMPTVSKKDAVVELPRVIATAEYFNARVELIVKDKAGNELPIYTPDTDEEKVKPGYVKLDSTGKYSFITSVEGSYTVTYTAYYGTTNLPPQTYTIQAGDIIAPSFKLATEHDTKAVENGKFTFKEVVIEGDNGDNAVITDEELKSYRFTKTLKAPDGTIVFQVDEYGEKGRTRTIPTDKNNEPYVFDKTGPYTVEYRVYDKAGNSVPFSETITVTAAKVNNPFSTKVISTILIIVGVLLIAGVILYFVRFRKNKSSK